MSPTRVDSAGRAYKGSQLQVQIYVNRRRTALEKALQAAVPSLAKAARGFQWVSPLESEQFKEFRDGGFLDALGQSSLREPLRRFWPARGASWDALARVELDNGRQGVLLLEGKSHVPEMVSTASAKSVRSRNLIRRTLEDVRRWAGARPDADWLMPHYQTANRLAHAAFFERHGVPVWLVFLCFLDDPHAPTSRAKWESVDGGQLPSKSDG